MDKDILEKIRENTKYSIAGHELIITDVLKDNRVQLSCRMSKGGTCCSQYCGIDIECRFEDLKDLTKANSGIMLNEILSMRTI